MAAAPGAQETPRHLRSPPGVRRRLVNSGGRTPYAALSWVGKRGFLTLAISSRGNRDTGRVWHLTLTISTQEEGSDETHSSKKHRRRGGCTVDERRDGEGRCRLGLERDHVQYDRQLEPLRPGALRSDHPSSGVRGGQRDYRRLRSVPRHEHRLPQGRG